MNRGDPGEPMFQALLDALPVPFFLVDTSMRLTSMNSAAESLSCDTPSKVIHRLCGELLGCIHEHHSLESCGNTENCDTCVIRSSVLDAHEGHRIIRRSAVMNVYEHDTVREIHYLVTASPFENGGKQYFYWCLKILPN